MSISTDSPGAVHAEHYAIGAARVVALLRDTGAAFHRGDWRSIAESFEVLPDDE